MKVVSIVNLKGGVGKTVTAINMAAILALDYKKRVLLIDADSQCNSTDFLGAGADDGGLYYFLTGEADYYPDWVATTNIPGVDIITASSELMTLDLSKVEDKTVHVKALRDLRDALIEDDAYDYVIIDLPPAFTASATAALLATDDVVIPIKLDAFSLRGMANLMQQVMSMRQINPALRVAGCLITMRGRSETTADAERQLRGMGLPVFAQAIRWSDMVDGMTFAKQPLPQFSPRSAAGVDYRRFVAEYLGGGVGNG
ncbi:MAG TPA: ParA family protein [Oscillospiraceae bacterium]|nr:ParA family protein [Oscillospiraceae bacterium]